MELVGAKVDTHINLRDCSTNGEKETLCSMVLNFINPGTLAKVHPKHIQRGDILLVQGLATLGMNPGGLNMVIRTSEETNIHMPVLPKRGQRWMQ